MNSRICSELGKNQLWRHRGSSINGLVLLLNPYRECSSRMWDKNLKKNWVVRALGFLLLSLNFSLYDLYFIMRRLFFYLTVADPCHKLSWLLNKGPALGSSNVKLLCCTLMKFYMHVQSKAHFIPWRGWCSELLNLF